jgi:hypothetical protein
MVLVELSNQAYIPSCQLLAGLIAAKAVHGMICCAARLKFSFLRSESPSA